MLGEAISRTHIHSGKARQVLFLDSTAASRVGVAFGVAGNAAFYVPFVGIYVAQKDIALPARGFI